MTNRLGYTLNVVFKHILKTDFSITTDPVNFEEYGDAKLCYAETKIGDGLFIRSIELLFQTIVEEQETRCFCNDGQWMMYPTYGRDVDLPFDIFAATFFMISRYEEYLPHHRDVHGRFCATESVAYTYGFLEQPVVEQWAWTLAKKIKQRYVDWEFKQPQYRFVQTVDVDAAWAYLHKGIYRSLSGWVRDLFVRRDIPAFIRRWRVVLHREQDPYDTFDYIINRHLHQANSHLIFFVLMADYDQFDKPVSYFNPYFRQLLQHIGDYAKMGLHPGYGSIENPRQLDVELERLEGAIHRTIVRSRYHFLRLQLPHSYRILMHAGIKHDYTLGYADAVGFRAGMSSPFPFYDLERDCETPLTIHPFCVMDTTLKQYLSLSPGAAIDVYKALIDGVRSVNGTFCCIVHNQNLSDIDGWGEWRNVYEQMVDYAQPYK